MISEKDFPLWVEINLELLKGKAYDLVDWENLLAVILEHLCKWDNFRGLTRAGEERDSMGWIKSVENSRRHTRTLRKKLGRIGVKI
ncbi:MAG: hypothetical protein ACK4MW_02985 [Aquificaceae bacterium]